MAVCPYAARSVQMAESTAGSRPGSWRTLCKASSPSLRPPFTSPPPPTCDRPFWRRGADVAALARLSLFLQPQAQPRAHAPPRCRTKALQQLLASFQQAERCGLADLADLYYNRAALHVYCQARTAWGKKRKSDRSLPASGRQVLPGGGLKKASFYSLPSNVYLPLPGKYCLGGA
eukprot:352100-Chlamydomonas_euryale.AAC.1